MDLETSEAITTLRTDIAQVRADMVQVETNLRADIGNVEASLRTDLTSVESSLRADIRRVETTVSDRIDSLSGQLGATTSSLRNEIRQMGQDSKRHTKVLVESLRDDIRIIAEGLASLSAKVESLRPPERRP
jgi:phage-related minor tail protein